ncbi:hypothetical protein GH714_006296 [Hevea brasiliensis]|uniref:Retroviral polymerase SH3-like domain-containing protein n=1 Tax=Hevea brasiliensis TaxID=3981 RepID=A0A6A6NBT6_HEVBR|nr:hypothetical protein GH714_035071 [Hevea brasiliensis]KAF2297292.1 hypothetical protein GH714_020855 [Hevea brasiliensis]KAF2322076.1 hypothetical protein GH714_006296 [Hevea brasiliensis]
MINARERHKLEEKSIKCIFIGYCSQTKAYRVYNPATGKVIISRNTVFNEEDCWQWEDEGKAPVFQINDGEEIHSRKTGSMTTSESNSAASPVGSNSVSRSSVGLNLSNNVAGSSNGETDNDDDDSETSPMKTRSSHMEVKKQPTVAISSCEAEYVAGGAAACEAVWMRKLLLDLGMKQEGATEIYSDSSSAIAMTKNPVFHGRAKHIEIKHHFIRELVAKEEISLKFCNSDEQIADIFTKALPYSKFSYLRSKLGMGEFESRGGVRNVIQITNG